MRAGCAISAAIVEPALPTGSMTVESLMLAQLGLIVVCGSSMTAMPLRMAVPLMLVLALVHAPERLLLVLGLFILCHSAWSLRV